jgi:methylglyoxal synthase
MGKVLEKELGSKITVFESGPLVGDQQIGARISEGSINFFISSTLMAQEYPRILPDYDSYRQRLRNQ